MKATELRIGNHGKEITHSKNRITKTTKQHFENIEKGEIDLFPIPLTEERMLEFGAVEIEVAGMDNEFKIMANEFYISWDKTYGVIIFTLDGEHSFSIEHIKYVHQLQNFYFGRTGQELTIKQ